MDQVHFSKDISSPEYTRSIANEFMQEWRAKYGNQSFSGRKSPFDAQSAGLGSERSDYVATSPGTEHKQAAPPERNVSSLPAPQRSSESPVFPSEPPETKQGFQNVSGGGDWMAHARQQIQEWSQKPSDDFWSQVRVFQGKGIPGVDSVDTGNRSLDGTAYGARPENPSSAGILPDIAASPLPGINPTTKVINVAPELRQIMADQLYDAVNVYGHMTAAGILGATIESTKWGLDVAHAKGYAPWWHNFSGLTTRFAPEERALEKAALRLESAKAGLTKAGNDLSQVIIHNTEFTHAKANLANLEANLEVMKKTALSEQGLLSAAASGLAKGVLVSAATMGAAAAVDKWLGAKPQMNGIDRFLIDGLLVPSILLASNIPIRYRIGMAALPFALARYYDTTNSGMPGLSKNSMLARPNAIDTLGLTGVVLSPFGIKAKVLLGLGTLAAGRLYNIAVHDSLQQGPELLANANESLAKDRVVRTTNSFDESVESYLVLSRHAAGEGQLDLKLADITNSQATMQPTDYLRQHAILSLAIGKARLEKGSRIVEGGSNAVEIYGENARILKEQKCDFLGEAMFQFAQAFTDLSDLRFALHSERTKTQSDNTLAESEKNARIASLDAQIKQSDEERMKIDGTLKTLFGPLEIDRIFAELSQTASTRFEDVSRILQKRQELFSILSQNVNPQIRSKLARDLALGYLATAHYASSKGNGGDAALKHQKSLEFFKAAQSLEPANPNLQKIGAIVQQVGTGVNQSLSIQYGNNFNNPFQLNTPTYQFESYPYGSISGMK